MPCIHCPRALQPYAASGARVERSRAAPPLGQAAKPAPAGLRYRQPSGTSPPRTSTIGCIGRRLPWVASGNSVSSRSMVWAWTSTSARWTPGTLNSMERSIPACPVPVVSTSNATSSSPTPSSSSAVAPYPPVPSGNRLWPSAPRRSSETLILVVGGDSSSRGDDEFGRATLVELECEALRRVPPVVRILVHLEAQDSGSKGLFPESRVPLVSGAG